MEGGVTNLLMDPKIRPLSAFKELNAKTQRCKDAKNIFLSLRLSAFALNILESTNLKHYQME